MNTQYYGLHIKKAKPNFLYLLNRKGKVLRVFKNEHQARTILEIYDILRIFQTTSPQPEQPMGGYITRCKIDNALQITVRDPSTNFLEDGTLHFFFYGTKPHTYDKKTASIIEWKQNEYVYVETPSNLASLKLKELLSLSDTIYIKLYPEKETKEEIEGKE